MALYAEGFRIGTKLMCLLSSVRIVTTCTIQNSFFEAMMCRLVKVGVDRVVAGETEITLLLSQHRHLSYFVHLCLVLWGWMKFMTGRASHTCTEMLAQLSMRLFASFFMAVQTRGRDFIR